MKVAWLFPGQGAQTVGMGQKLFAASKAARAVFERADVALGEPLSKLVFEGPEADLTRTANAQPAIVTTSPTATSADRASPVATPTSTGSAAPLAEIGATMLIVPIASAL